MSPRASVFECGPVSREVAELRLLTEVNQLCANIDAHGVVPLEVEMGIKQNMRTGIAEISMPYAVTTTMHRVEYRTDEHGRSKRVITWLGKNAVEVAMGGKDFHFSKSALDRVEVEVDEAKHAEENLKGDIAQVFISPKMSAYDAPLNLARAEHLADEDSLRVSTPVLDADGVIIARKMQSVLVRDIPLEAWVAMLQDENNIFGKSFAIADTRSALSIMKLFSELELPQDKIQDGPVAIIKSVLPYMTDEIARRKVIKQIKRFQCDQNRYENEAQLKADEWFDFDLELAKSLKKKETTFEIRRFIISLQDEWESDEAVIISRHSMSDTAYEMTEELAAILEKKKRLLLGRVAAVMTGNDVATARLSPEQRSQIIVAEEQLRQAQLLGVSDNEMRLMQAEQSRRMARANVKVGGGCAGGFSPETVQQDLQLGPKAAGVDGLNSADDDKNTWKWKNGVCQVKACPSPKPTEVGPCSVCKRCQAEFDRGHDPTKDVAPKAKITAKAGGEAMRQLFVIEKAKPSSDQDKTKKPRHLHLVP